MRKIIKNKKKTFKDDSGVSLFIAIIRFFYPYKKNRKSKR